LSYRQLWEPACRDDKTRREPSWHDLEMTGPGAMTLLLGDPDETTLRPARSDEIVR
jgi:hypothetical protein